MWQHAWHRTWRHTWQHRWQYEMPNPSLPPYRHRPPPPKRCRRARLVQKTHARSAAGKAVKKTAAYSRLLVFQSALLSRLPQLGGSSAALDMRQARAGHVLRAALSYVILRVGCRLGARAVRVEHVQRVAALRVFGLLSRYLQRGSGCGGGGAALWWWRVQHIQDPCSW